MFCRRSGNRNIAQALGRLLQMNWVAAGEFQEIGEASKGVAALTGQAVLSRFPISNPSVIVFRHQSRLRWRLNPIEPRRDINRIEREYLARTSGGKREGFFTRQIRRWSISISRQLLRVQVSPNQVTVAGFILALAAALSFSVGYHFMFAPTVDG